MKAICSGKCTTRIDANTMTPSDKDNMSLANLSRETSHRMSFNSVTISNQITMQQRANSVFISLLDLSFRLEPFCKLSSCESD
jgi:hypothetical protein